MNFERLAYEAGYRNGVAAERERVLLELTAMVRDLGWLPSDVARLRARITGDNDA